MIDKVVSTRVTSISNVYIDSISFKFISIVECTSLK